jgi:hypothetical protein
MVGFLGCVGCWMVGYWMENSGRWRYVDWDNEIFGWDLDGRITCGNPNR